MKQDVSDLTVARLTRCRALADAAEKIVRADAAVKIGPGTRQESAHAEFAERGAACHAGGVQNRIFS